MASSTQLYELQSLVMFQFGIALDQLFAVILGLLIVMLIISSSILVVLRDRRRSAGIIDQLLLDQMTISLVDLRDVLQKPRLDRASLRSIVRSCENALLGFTGTTVISYPLLRARLRQSIHDDTIIRTAHEADMWGLSDATISDLVESTASDEGVDVLRTKTGDYVVVTSLKGRLYDDLRFQGHINIANEAQRLSVDQSHLLELVYSWGWDVIEVSDEVVASTDWVRVILERMVISQGFLSPMDAAERIGIGTDDLRRLLKRLDWAVITTEDGDLIPLHIVEEYLRDKLERDNVIDVPAAAAHFKLSPEVLVKTLKQIDRQIIETTRGEVVTLDYVRKQVDASIRISGRIHPSEVAELIGVDSRLVVQILHSNEEYRRVPDGSYVSLQFFREWLLGRIKEDGIIQLDEVESEWGIPSVDLRVLLKRFGIKTTPTVSGDLLSLQWARDQIRTKLKAGLVVSPEDVAREFGVEPGVAVALIANTESDAYQTRDGRLVPESILRDKLRERFVERGTIDPEQEAHRLGLDVSLVERLIDSLTVDSVEARSGTRVSIAGILTYTRKRLEDNGVADLAKIAQTSGVDYETLVSLMERRLADTEDLVDAAQCIVRLDWVESVLKPLAASGQIHVNEFAKKHDLRRSAALHILRAYLKGAYIKSRDIFIAVESDRF